ncbi:MAG: alpha/beta hydrolase [Actinomycetota bacterium]|nr:alpha/beta hydrolase [Actinomycetota bacterium]
MSVPAYSQLTSHSASRVDFPGIAAVRTGGDGPIVLLVPGYTGSKEDFAPLLDPLASAGFDAVAIDLPGQQDSPALLHEDDYLPAKLGARLAELIGSFDRPVILLGHSYGGLACRHAVLTGARVVGLTLLASGPGELPAGGRRQILELGESLLREHGVAAVQRAMDVLNSSNPRWQNMSEPLRAFLRTRFLRHDMAALIGMGRGIRDEPDLVPELARTLRSTGAACLVACGALDDVWPPAQQREMAERLEADFSLIGGSVHSPSVENPEELLAVLLPTWKTWLDGHM